MQIRIDVLDVGQRDRFVEQLLVEWQRETPIQHVIVEHRNAENAPDKVKVRQMFRINGCKEEHGKEMNSFSLFQSSQHYHHHHHLHESGLICSE